MSRRGDSFLSQFASHLPRLLTHLALLTQTKKQE